MNTIGSVDTRVWLSISRWLFYGFQFAAATLQDGRLLVMDHGDADHLSFDVFKDLATLIAAHIYPEDVIERIETELHSGGVSIDELQLSVRVYNALCYHAEPKIETIGQLISYTKSELFRVKGFGKISLAEVQAALAQRGLKLREEN